MPRFHHLLLLAVVVIASLSTSCAPPAAGVPAGEDARRAMLARLAEHAVLPLLADLESAAQTLVETTAALDDAAGQNDDRRADARAALAAVQATWQQLEVMHAGPAGAPTTFTGGLGLREGIHSWPLVSRCGADQQTALGRFTDDGWARGRTVDVLGLHTLEYLLFRADAGNDCPAAASLNDSGTWAALGDDVVVARRATYARVVAEDVREKIVAMRRAWTSDFAQTLAKAGLSGSSFSTAQQALDEVYAALFVVDLATKDKKIGVPAGLHVDCAADVCPSLTESPTAHLSLAHIEANLRGARVVLTGSGVGDEDEDGPGFDDLLKDAGHDDAATTLVQRLDDALAATRGLGGTLEQVLVTDPARARELYAVVQRFTDELKSTLPSLLGLRVPDEGAGDND
jgi:predicted lipoprotein